LDLSTFLIVLSGKNKKNGFYFSDKRSIGFCFSNLIGKKDFREIDLQID
jgi:hypothetical protein